MPGVLTMRDALARDLGEHYRTLLTISGEGRDIVFDAETTEATLDLGQPAVSGWLGFIGLGAGHILAGADHLLFLATLLVASTGFWRALGVVTAFTAAHSVTLSLAALGLVAAPGGIVEPLIAASIVWVAVENLFARTVVGRRWLVTFLFGLVHGFGFASALAEIEPARLGLLRSLVGFNLGVELGQALIVMSILPLVAWMRRQGWGATALKAFSVFSALAGAIWLIERVFFA